MKWINFKDKQPEIGQQVNVKFNRHKYGTIHSTSEQLGKYIGMNTVIDMPMVEFDYKDDECYMELTHWKPSEIVSSNDCSKNGGIDIIAQCYSGFNYESTMDECKANAKLIVEAGNVANETGKTPRQLVDENKELLEALIEVKMELINHIMSLKNESIFMKINNAIDKATK